MLFYVGLFNKCLVEGEEIFGDKEIFIKKVALIII